MNSTLPPLGPCNSTSADSDSTAALPSFWVGVIAAIVGSIVLAMGMNIQRLAHLQLQRKMSGKSFVFDRTWQLGLVIFAFGNFGDAIALAYAPQSVVTPLGCFSLVANIFSSKLVLGEQIRPQTAVGSATIILGVLAIVLPSSSGVGDCDDEDLDTLIRRWSRPVFRSFAVCHVLTLLGTLLFVRRLESCMRSAAEGCQGEPSAHVIISAESSEAGRDRAVHPTGGPVRVRATPQLLALRERLLLRLSYPLLIGLVASWTVLLVKTAGSLIRATSREGIGIWGRYESWLMIIGLFVSIPTQLTYLNRALANFEALFVVPALQCFWSLSSISMGAIFFQEFDLYKPWMYAVFMSGVAVSLVGLVIISTASAETPDWVRNTIKNFSVARTIKSRDARAGSINAVSPAAVSPKCPRAPTSLEPTPSRSRVLNVGENDEM